MEKKLASVGIESPGELKEFFTNHFKGDCLLAVGDGEMIKIHFHTNEPWKVLEYCASLGEIYDIVIEDMDRQSRGLKGYIFISRGTECIEMSMSVVTNVEVNF